VLVCKALFDDIMQTEMGTTSQKKPVERLRIDASALAAYSRAP
jgi:hypothetical protein